MNPTRAPHARERTEKKADFQKTPPSRARGDEWSVSSVAGAAVVEADEMSSLSSLSKATPMDFESASGAGDGFGSEVRAIRDDWSGVFLTNTVPAGVPGVKKGSFAV